SFYKNPRVDELIDRARHELDDERRKKLDSEAAQLICDDAPWAFTQYYRWYSIRQPYAREWRPHPVWTHELSRTWIDRAADVLGVRTWLRGDVRSVVTGLFGAPERPLQARRATP